MNSSKRIPVPDKVKRVELENFRGWAGKHTLEFDADFVLISGANGFGKSSLMEALALVLSNTKVHSTETIPSIVSKDGKHERAGWWKVELTVGQGDQEDKLGRSDDADVDRPLPGTYHPGSETIRRATLFRQDPLEAQFEDGGDDTLLGFIAPFPAWLKRYEDALRRAEEALEAQRPREVDATARMRAERRRDDVAKHLAERIAGELGVGGADISRSGTPPMEHLVALVRRLTGSELDGRGVTRAKRIRAALSQSYRLTDAFRTRLAKAIDERDAARTEMDALEREWPRDAVRRLSGWFEGNVSLNDLLRLLEQLSEVPATWKDTDGLLQAIQELPEQSQAAVPRIDELQRDVTREFERVDPARATRARKAVAAWCEYWSTIESRFREREERLAIAERELKRLQRAQENEAWVRLVDRLVEHEAALERLAHEAEIEARRQERWPRIKACLEAVGRQREWIRKLREAHAGAAPKEQVQRTMNAVMNHFVVAGMSKAGDIIALKESDKTLTPDFSDNRTLHGHFSTGQKAQTATAWLLGTNALLQEWLPHRVLLLDDLSTALDLTNLAAQSALLRKFVYTHSEGRKRQVVLATHHDQLSSRIYDLMLPPSGFTMREIQLVGWDMGKGPQVEDFTITSTRKADDEARKKLAEILGRIPNEE